jgi:hypothetical protein
LATSAYNQAGRGIGNAIASFFGGNPQARQAGEMAGLQAASLEQQIAGSKVSTALGQAKLDEAERQRTLAAPRAALTRAAQLFGVPTENVPDLEEWQRTGRLPDRLMTPGAAPPPPMGNMGPVQPPGPPAPPSWGVPANLTKIAQLMFGDQSVQAGSSKTLEDAMKALVTQPRIGLTQGLADGSIAPAVGGARSAAIEGKPLVSAHEYGVVDNFSGAVDDANPVASRFGQFRTAATDAQRANAEQSRASAANSRATEKKTMAELKHLDGEDPFAPPKPVLGVPVPTVMPWANQSNGKDANKVKLAEIARGGKEVEKDTDAARKERVTAEAAKRFIELNEEVNTGGLTDKMGVTRLAQSMGPKYSEMESITARLAPAMREPGSGSTSDFDGKQFERATVGVDKPKAANKNIATAIIARAELAQDYADFRQTYLEQNGTLQGADRHWKQYTDQNPIFDRRKKDGFDLNPNRKGWREHFGAGAAPAAQPPVGGGADQPVQVTSDADYTALKPGTRFVTPDGRTGTKR